LENSKGGGRKKKVWREVKLGRRVVAEVHKRNPQGRGENV